jgi:succinate dehydrogenase (ubiquinone) iron-sulfur subunit
MRYNLEKDKKNRILFKNSELRRKMLKGLKMNQFLSLALRINANFKLSEESIYLPKIRNYCIETGRARGILRSFKVSRMVFKSYASNGFFVGIKKSSW